MPGSRVSFVRGLGGFWGLLFVLSSFFGVEAGESGGLGGSKMCSHTGFYSKKVVAMCAKHFPDDSAKNAWIVQFYHPQVQINFLTKGAYESLATSKGLEGSKVGAVDCAQNGEFCKQHGIRKAPTTRMIYQGETREFTGDHNFEDLQKFVKDSLKYFREMEAALQCKFKGVFKDAKKDSTVPMCLTSFPPNTESSPWLISFYESGDRNKDKTMLGTMNKLAEKYGNTPPKKADAASKRRKMRVGAVECSDQGGCAEFGITSFPTVRFYRSGAEPATFDSSFDRADIQKWADARLKEIPKVKVEVLKGDAPEGEAASSSPKTEL